MNLLPRLRSIADRWVELWSLTDASISLKTLAVRAVDNAKLFDRPTMTVDTYERVVAFLADPKSWPLAEIPEDVAAVLVALRAEDDAALASAA